MIGEIQEEMESITTLLTEIINFSDWFDVESVDTIRSWLNRKHPAATEKLLSLIVSNVDDVMEENSAIQEEILEDFYNRQEEKGDNHQIMASIHQAFLTGKLLNKSTDTLMKVLRIISQIHFDLLEFGVKVKTIEKSYTDRMFNNRLDEVRAAITEIGEIAATKATISEKELSHKSALIQKNILAPLTNYLNNKAKKAIMHEYVLKIEMGSKNFTRLQKEKRDQILALL